MISIDENTLTGAKISEESLRMEIGAILYQYDACSLRKAASLVGVPWTTFQSFLGEKGIETYTVECLKTI